MKFYISIKATITCLFCSIMLSVQASNLSLSDYVEGYNSPKNVSAMTYVDDDEVYLLLSSDKKRVEKFDSKTGKFVEAVFKTDYTRETTLNTIDGFILSPDGSKMLVWTDSREQYRHSFTAKYYVYEFRSRLLRPLSEERQRQQAPIFSPDGRMVAYVADNNIYIKKLDYGSDIAVTKDGAVNKIINGVPDWTYQEEFSTTQSLAWAPDNLTLCFLKYNETNVPRYSFPLYKGSCPEISEYALYPGQFSYKYPVAGEKNSEVTLHSYNIETRKTLNLSLADDKIEYIPRIAYTTSTDALLVVTLNRNQNRMEIYSINPKSNVAKSILVEQAKTWIIPESYEELTLLDDGFVLPSNRSGYQHYYKYTYSGTLSAQLTTGNFDVTAYYGFNKEKGCHFYQSTQNGAINRTVYRKDRNGKIFAITPDNGYASAAFSPGMKYCTVCYSSATTVPEYSFNNVVSGKQLRILESNKECATKFAQSPKAEFFKMTAGGIEFNGSIIKPSGFNPAKKYPVVMNQYSGPGSQEVLNRWSMGWANYFAEHGYVVITVDGRGTGGRGREFMEIVYKNLGYYESIDQIAAAKYAASLPYCDANRIGIYGWSYGGYEAIMAASTANAPYAAAVAVAPVTDWRFYDTVYAERYMLTPEQNESGYESSSALSHVDNLKCPLLIIAGTADDNVHFYNTLHYMTKLQEINKWADVMPVANANHFIRGCGKRTLVYSRMLDYLNRIMK